MKQLHYIKVYTCIMVSVLLLQSCTSGGLPAPTQTPSSTTTASPTSAPALTPTESPTPKPAVGFLAGGKPFRFIGAFIPGWYWGDWMEANDVAVITEARQAGISVLHIMFPEYEYPLGTVQESQLVKLDHFLDVANQNGIYVIGSFIHGLGMTSNNSSPFFDPNGIGALINRPEFRSGFKAYMATLVNRTNTINGRNYSDDPTILAWMIIEEIVSAPWNYPNGFPDVTVSQIVDWLEENAAFLKSIDPNHLVTINITAAIDTFSSSLNQQWTPIIETPSLDFIEAEDAEARILLFPEQMHTIDEIYAVGKPIVQMLSYTGGGIDPEKYCNDYKWQADTMNQVADLYLRKDAVGLTIFAWRVSNITPPGFDKCYSYDIKNTDIVGMIQGIASELGEKNTPPSPLEFVTLSNK